MGPTIILQSFIFLIICFKKKKIFILYLDFIIFICDYCDQVPLPRVVVWRHPFDEEDHLLISRTTAVWKKHHHAAI